MDERFGIVAFLISSVSDIISYNFVDVFLDWCQEIVPKIDFLSNNQNSIKLYHSIEFLFVFPYEFKKFSSSLIGRLSSTPKKSVACSG